MTDQNREEPVNADEAAKFLKLRRTTVLDMARKGTLPAHPVTNGGQRKRWAFYISELDRHLRGRGVHSPDPCAV